MTTKPIITSVSGLPPITIHQYERYLPTAFDESLTILQKMNKLINHLNEIGDVSNNLVKQWNELMVWIVGNGLTDTVSDEIDERINDGTFDTLVYRIVGDLNLLDTIDKTDMVKALNEINKIATENDVEIGDISALNTNNKNSLVEALNEMLVQVLINKNAPTSIGEATGHGTISGLKVTQQNVLSMAVEVGNGTDTNIVHMPNGVRYTPNSISLPVKPSHATLNRKDIIYVNDQGVISYLEGVTSVTPITPNLPIGSVLLAEINVLATDTTINDSDIVDKRNLKSLSQLLTNNKSNLVSAINEIITSLNDLINNAVGDVANLPTTDKTSVVNAIVEVVNKMATKIDLGDKTSLNTSDKTSIVLALNEVLTKLGDKATLNTMDKTSIVDAINEVLSKLNTTINDVGDKTTLNTTDKSSVVKAINEVIANLGDKNILKTTNKTSFVGAINEISDKIGTSVTDGLNAVMTQLTDIATSVKTFGAKGDGVTDDKIAIQNALKSGIKNIYFPPGTYRVSPPLTLDATIHDKSIVFDLQAKLLFDSTTEEGHGVQLSGCYNLEFLNLNIEHRGIGQYNALRFDEHAHHLNFLGRTKVYDSPMWAVNIRGASHDIYIQYIEVDNTIKGKARTGGDGIDFHSCYNVTLDTAIVKAGDDAVCVKSVGDHDVQTRNINIGIIYAQAFGGAISFGSEIRQNCFNINVGQVVSYECLYAVYIRNDTSGTGILSNVNIGNVTHYDTVGTTNWGVLIYSVDDMKRIQGIHIGSVIGQCPTQWDFVELRNVKEIKIDHVDLRKMPAPPVRVTGSLTRNRFGIHFNGAKDCYIGSGRLDTDGQTLYFFGSSGNIVKNMKCVASIDTPLTFYGNSVTSLPSSDNTLEMVDFSESFGTKIQTHVAYGGSTTVNNKLIRTKGIVSESTTSGTIIDATDSITINHGLSATPNIAFAWSTNGGVVSVSVVTATQITVKSSDKVGVKNIKVFASL